MKAGKKRFFYIALAAILICLIVVVLARRKPQNEPVPVNIEKGEISSGESFYSCLLEEGLSPSTIYRITEALKPYYDVRICRPGDKYEVINSTDGFFLGFRFYHNIYVYSVEKSTIGVFTAEYNKVPMEEKIVGAAGRIKDSLWAAMINQGLSPDLVMRFTDIFSWQIDFLTEPRRDDRYKLVWIRYQDTNGNIIDGKILSAQYEGEETGSYTALIFDNKYYDLNGKSLHRQFLRAPLNYRRISSYFTKRRFHPILKYYRPHSGIDYAAPTGTPVVSIGDGTVTHCGWKGQSGKCVIIRHNSIYTSAYGHLHGYGKRIKKGVKVKQGQVIGFVGSTGLSTGPHLDFRIRKYGKFVNFLKLKIPPSRSVNPGEMNKFKEIKKERLSQLALVFGSTVEPVLK